MPNISIEISQKNYPSTSFSYKTSRLVRISLLINVLNKRVLLFSEESYFIKAIQDIFPVFAYPDINSLRFALLSRSLPTPLVFILGYANTENVFYCLNINL